MDCDRHALDFMRVYVLVIWMKLRERHGQEVVLIVVIFVCVKIEINRFDFGSILACCKMEKLFDICSSINLNRCHCLRLHY